MRRFMFLLTCAVLGAALAACGQAATQPAPSETEADTALFDWPRSPDTIVVRLDARNEAGNPVQVLNAIPPCTLWGDGRVVWVTWDEYGAQQVLEGRASDAAIRAFLEYVIGQGFYNWEDDLAPADPATALTETITVNLYGEVRTVRRYNSWPDGAYEAILERCAQLSTTPVLVLPWGGWLSAVEVARNDTLPRWYWPSDLPFTPADLVANGEARWLRGEYIDEIWAIVRDPASGAQVIGPDERAYHLALAVPGISRDAAPPPPGEDRPLPTPGPAETETPAP